MIYRKNIWRWWGEKNGAPTNKKNKKSHNKSNNYKKSLDSWDFALSKINVAAGAPYSERSEFVSEAGKISPPVHVKKFAPYEKKIFV